MLEIMLSIARNEKLSPMARIIAADKVLDRAYGKPKEMKEVEVSHTRTRQMAVDSLTDEQLEALEAALERTVLQLEAQTIIEGEA